MIYFAIIDDHPLVVEGIQSLFRTDDRVRPAWGTVCVQTGERLLTESPVDVLLLDIHLDGADGVRLCRDYRQRFPNLHILMLSSYAETALVKTALQNGASGYLLKNAGYAELAEGIDTASRGGRYLSPRLQEYLLADALGQPAAQKMAYLPTLTRREVDVLQLIIAELTTSEIADKLFITPKTVETHRTNLLQKLGVRNTAGLVRRALEKGLV
ncbi:MAG: response regulator transcription factor [Bacteroidetes bacterium]|nr:response regulator transcription factor [Fibrella sp.]